MLDVVLVVVVSDISPNCILTETFDSVAVLDLQSPNQDIPRHHFEYFGSFSFSRLIPFTGFSPRSSGYVGLDSVAIIELLLVVIELLLEKGTSVIPQKSPLVNSVSI